MTETKSTEMGVVISARNNKDGFAVEGPQTSPAPVKIHSRSNSAFLKGAVNLGSYVILSVRASYLPACITQNECSTCFKALQVNVVNANVPILTTVNFVPLSQWQFVIKFDFQGLIVSSIFKVVIKLNESFRGCFAD